MQIKNIVLFHIILICDLIKESLSYNDSIPFNWTKIPDICYVDDFVVTNQNRPYYEDIYPVRGCNSDERNRLYALKGANFGLTNITYEPALDFFFPRQKFPPLNSDPPSSMTFRITTRCNQIYKYFSKNQGYVLKIFFGRSEDYLSVPIKSKKYGFTIQKYPKTNKKVLQGRVKIIKDYLINDPDEYNYTIHDYEILEYEGEDFYALFDGYELDFSFLNRSSSYTKLSSSSDFCKNNNDVYAIILKVYDLPRMKVQGLFQYNLSEISPENEVTNSFIYTVDTRNIFFQNISMFYNQHVNVTKEGLEPTAEDSGIWINTTCNVPNVATIMVDYFFFETIHKMQYFGYEFSDRFQLRIHTPYYRKTLNKKYSLFRSQWNSSYPKPRVFIHPIYKYREYCKVVNCTEMFNYTKWTTDPIFTSFIMDIKNEIIENEIRINFTELEKIYEADGFHRPKLSINVNNTMAPHISGVTNGLWAELVDTLTNDWVMKTKITMDEVYGYSEDDEPDPYRNFYLTCEIPDNITKDDVEFKVKKYGLLSTGHFWFRLDVFNKGITKMYPPRFNFVIKLPPPMKVTNRTFMYTYQYYRIPGNYTENMYYITKDLRKTGLLDGTITEDTFDIKRNIINISELHPNYPNGDDTMFYTQTYDYFCNMNYTEDGECYKLEIKRQFLYYFFDLDVGFYNNNSYPIDMTVYYIKYVPYHSKNQINRGLHRWNPRHAGWKIPDSALYVDPSNNKKSYRYYYEPELDNYFYREEGSTTFTNKLGPTGIDKYDGPDCIFNFAGGSTMRNKSCEYWVGLIPDQPFTNYARDIYEEHLAYRTLNYDMPFIFYNNETVKADIMNFYILEPYPGKFTGIRFQVMFWLHVDDALIDGEPKCGEFYEYPSVCEGVLDQYKPVYNIHKKTNAIFLKIELPYGLAINSSLLNKVLPCWWNEKGPSYFTENTMLDYLCFYWNESFIYAFESKSQSGFCLGSGHWDAAIQIDGLYIYDNITKFNNGSGMFKQGFFETDFHYSEFPRGFDYELEIKDNFTLGAESSNTTNEANSIFSFKIIAKNIFDVDTVIRLDLSEYFNHLEPYSISYNGEEITKENLDILINNNYFSHNSEEYNIKWKQLKLPLCEEVNQSIVVYPYYWIKNTSGVGNYSIIEKNETLEVDIKFKTKNARSKRPLKIDFYRTNDTFNTIFQNNTIYYSNSKSKDIFDLTIKTNSFYTNDRAIYTMNFWTNADEIIQGDILEFKTSWRANYTNVKDKNDSNYFVNQYVFDRNYTKEEMKNITIYIKPGINPDILDEQYFKDIKLLDKDEYAIAEYNGPKIPIKMKRYISFKSGEVTSIGTENDSNKFNITFDLIPEVLIKSNDTLKLKFSSNVLLKDVSNFEIVGIKGINFDSSNESNIEYDIDNNELIISGGFDIIGETEFIFDDLNASALVDQEIVFTLLDIPIKYIDEEEDSLFSVEATTISNDIITQIDTLPSNAHFNCILGCKTCEKDNRTNCITCKDEYPFLITTLKKCVTICPDIYYSAEKNGTKVCDVCDDICTGCVGTENNCTGCVDGYFLENNTCVVNCSENYELNEEYGRCYPIIFINDTKFNDSYIYVNVSTPTPYDVYIDKNVCLAEDVEIMEEKEIEKEKELEIFEENLEFIENEIFHELEINDVKEIIEEYKKEEIEEEIHNLIEKEKELEKEIFKEQEKEILFENEKEKELIYERIIEDEEEIIFVKEKEREIIFEKEKEDEEEIIIENEKEREIIIENVKEREIMIEKEKEREIMIEKEKEREIIIENEKEREKIIEKEKELNYEREKEKEEEISVEKEKEKEKISEIEKEIEIFNEEEVLFEKELILEKEEKELISEKAQETSFESEIEIEIQKEIIIEKEKEIEIKREIETEIEKNDFIEEIEKESEIFDIKKEKEIEKEYEKETETEKNKEIEIEKANEKGELLEKEEEIKHELEKEKEKEQKKENENEEEIEKEKELDNEKEIIKVKEEEKDIEKEIIEEEKEDETKKEKEIELDIEKEREKEIQIEKVKEKEKEIEEKEKELETESEKEKEKEKEAEMKKEKEMNKEKEIELEKEMEIGLEKEKEIELEKEIMKEKEKIKEIESEKELEKELENEIDIEIEKIKVKEEEEEKMKEKNKEMEKEKELEREKELEEEIYAETEKEIEIAKENISEMEKEKGKEIEKEKEKEKETEDEKEKELEKENEIEKKAFIKEKEFENEKEQELKEDKELEMKKEKEGEIEQEKEKEKELIKEKEKEADLIKEIEKENEKEKEIIKEMEIELENEKENYLEKEKEKIKVKEEEKEIEKEEYKEIGKIKEIEIEKDIEKVEGKEEEMEEEIEKEIEKIKGNVTEIEIEEEKEIEKVKEKELEKESEKEKETYIKEKMIEKEKETEKEIEIEKEIKKEDIKEEKEKEMEIEEEKEKEKEMEIEEEKEKSKHKENEIVKEKEKEVEMEKEKELEKEKENIKVKEEEKEIESEKEIEIIKGNETEKEEVKEIEKEKEKEKIKEIEKEKEIKFEEEQELDEKEKEILIKEKMLEKEKEAEEELETEVEKEKEKEKEAELEKEKEKKIVKEIEKETEKEKEIILEKEKEKEIVIKEKEIEKEIEKEKEKNIEKEEELEKEEDIIKEKELENEKEIIKEKEIESENEIESKIEKEEEKEEKNIEKEKEREIMKEIENIPEKEKENAKEKEKEEEKEEEKEKEIEKNKDKEIEKVKEKEKEKMREEKEEEEKEKEKEKIIIKEKEYIEAEKELIIEEENIYIKEITSEEELFDDYEKEIIGYEEEQENIYKNINTESDNILIYDEIEILEVIENEINKISVSDTIEKEKESKQETEKESKLEEKDEEEEEDQKEKEKEKEIMNDEIKNNGTNPKLNNTENDLNNMNTEDECNPYFFGNLQHIFKYKNPFDYYLIPIIATLGLILLEILFCVKILNLSFYIITYFYVGLLFKINLIVVFVYTFWTGYEYFFYTVAIIFMIHMYITVSFLIFNLCNKNSNNELKSDNKCLWFLSLIACAVSDYKCLEIFTRTKIEIINSDEKEKNKIAEIKKNEKDNDKKEQKKDKNIDNKDKNKINFKEYNNITSNEYDKTEANLKTEIDENNNITNEKNTSSFDNSKGLFNLNNNGLNLNKEVSENKGKESDKIDSNKIQKEKNEKYILVQESCINKTIITFDILFVYLSFIIICLFIIYKYKTYSFLWFISIYGVIISILHIMYYYRFRHIYLKEKPSKPDNKTKEKIVKKSPKNKNKIFGSSLGKLMDTKNSIKEAPSVDEQTRVEKQINIFDIKNIKDNKINNVNMKPMDTDNDEDIIYNPYREDFIPDSEVSKKSKNNINNNNIKELPLKNINSNDKSNSEENKALETYRSFGSEEYRLRSFDSQNPINRKKISDTDSSFYFYKDNKDMKNIPGFNSKLFGDDNDKNNEEKLDDEEDNSSVIQNPLRDDI